MAATEGRGAEPRERYYDVDFEPGDSHAFVQPTDTAMEGVMELLKRLPVRPVVRDPLGQDSRHNASLISSIDEVHAALARALRADYAANMEELGETCEFKTFVVEVNARPDALHLVTRLVAQSGSGGAILYASRVQRLTDESFALWSGHG